MRNILIIGFGNMGQAIGRALLGKGYKVFVCDKSAKKAKTVAGVNVWPRLDNLSVFDFVIVSVKPQDMPELGTQIVLSVNTILVSIAAGVTISKLQKLFHHQKVVRVMPNLGLSVGQGIAAWKSAGLTSLDKNRAKRLLNAICENFEVRDEKLINAVTAISGSGPAYFFEFAKDLYQASVRLGLSAGQSRMLVTKTMSAAAKLSENGNYQQLINQVASKKGTTEAALKVFVDKHLDKIVNKAAQAAYKRAGELSHG